MKILKYLIICLILSTLYGCGVLEAFSDTANEVKDVAFTDMEEALDSMSEDQLAELGSKTQDVYEDLKYDRDVLLHAEDAFEGAKDAAQSAAATEAIESTIRSTDFSSFADSIAATASNIKDSNPVADVSNQVDIGDAITSIVGPLEDTSGDSTSLFEPFTQDTEGMDGFDAVVANANNIIEAISSGIKKFEYNAMNSIHDEADVLANEDLPIISSVAGAVAKYTASAQRSLEQSDVKSKQAILNKAIDSYKSTQETMEEIGSSDEALQTYMKTGMTPKDIKNNKIGTIVLIALAILFLILILIVFSRPKIKSQPPVVIVSAPAHTVSNDVNVDYEALLHILCNEHGKNYDDVLKSFNGDVRCAVEKMKLL